MVLLVAIRNSQVENVKSFLNRCRLLNALANDSIVRSSASSTLRTIFKIMWYTGRLYRCISLAKACSSLLLTASSINRKSSSAFAENRPSSSSIVLFLIPMQPCPLKDSKSQKENLKGEQPTPQICARPVQKTDKRSTLA